jgi:adenosylcobinamide-GDP ribazoletransferase
MNNLILALTFLTIIPARNPSLFKGQLRQAAAWFPFVGLIIGVILYIVDFVVIQLFQPLLAAGIVVACWVIVTGGLHLDGLADCFDALFAPVSSERRLEILRDPRLGSFGVMGLCLYLLLKTLTVFSINSRLPHLLISNFQDISQNVNSSIYALIFAPVIARWLILLLGRQPLARSEGMGLSFADGLTSSILTTSAIIPLFMLVCGGVTAILAFSLALLLTIVINKLSQNRLGGVTGDVLGLTVELAELTILLTYAIQIPKS